VYRPDINIIEYGNTLPDEDLPGVVFFETTKGRPEFLGGRIPGNGVNFDFRFNDLGKTKGSARADLFGGDFLRLIAKIAHGFAVGALGLNAFSPMLTDIILGTENALHRYIGIGVDLPNSSLHRVRLTDGSALIPSANELSFSRAEVYIAYVQLFAQISAPVYEVIVGTKRTIL
jgi:hypothetical protein